MITIEVAWLAVTAMAATSPMKAVVFPLYASSESESIAWIGEGIAVSISAQLRGPRLSVMESSQVMGLMEDMGYFRGARLSLASMISIAQRVPADLAVIGSFEGTKKKLGIRVKIFYLRDLKFSGNISANGPISVLPQIENELAWQILTDIGIEKSLSREKYYERTRKIPNSAFELYIQSLGASGENNRLHLLRKAIDSYGNFPEAQFQLGYLYYSKGDCKSALPHLKRAGKGDDISTRAEFVMGSCYIQTDQSKLAIEAYSRILRDSRPPEVLNNLGVAYMREDENARALDAFSEANMLAPANPVTSLNLSIAQQIQGDISAAINTAEEAIHAHPNNRMLQFLLGFLFKSQGEEEKAAIAFQKAINQGLPVKKLLGQHPKAWTQIFTYCSENGPQP
jgi:Tfp pilus assembly protein PilF